MMFYPQNFKFPVIKRILAFHRLLCIGNVIFAWQNLIFFKLSPAIKLQFWSETGYCYISCCSKAVFPMVRKLLFQCSPVCTALHIRHFNITYLILNVAVGCLSVSEGWGSVGELGSCTAITHRRRIILGFITWAKGPLTYRFLAVRRTIFVLTDFICPLSLFPPLDHKSRSFEIHWTFTLFASLIMNWNLHLSATHT